jgi:circadian clock protein KaiC
VDSLSALERVGSAEVLPRLRHRPDAYVKESGVATLLTAAAPGANGAGTSVTDAHPVGAHRTPSCWCATSRRPDGWRRGLVVLKMRSSGHGHEVREFTIDDAGMHLGEPSARRAAAARATHTRL